MDDSGHDHEWVDLREHVLSARPCKWCRVCGAVLIDKPGGVEALHATTGTPWLAKSVVAKEV